MCAYSVFNTFPVYPLSAKPLILLAFCRYRYHTSLFDRPGFQKMIAEVKADRISVVIIKDMSRFGRDYLQVGTYMEVLRKHDKLLRDGRVRLKDCKSAKGKTYNATVLLSCEADGRSKFSLEFEGGC